MCRPRLPAACLAPDCPDPPGERIPGVSYFGCSPASRANWCFFFLIFSPLLTPWSSGYSDPGPFGVRGGRKRCTAPSISWEENPGGTRKGPQEKRRQAAQGGTQPVRRNCSSQTTATGLRQGAAQAQGQITIDRRSSSRPSTLDQGRRRCVPDRPPIITCQRLLWTAWPAAQAAVAVGIEWEPICPVRL